MAMMTIGLKDLTGVIDEGGMRIIKHDRDNEDQIMELDESQAHQLVILIKMLEEGVKHEISGSI